MEYFKDDSNAEDVWTKEDLLKSTYEPGEYSRLYQSTLTKQRRHIHHKSLSRVRKDTPVPDIPSLLVPSTRHTDTGPCGQHGGAPSRLGQGEAGSGLSAEDDDIRGGKRGVAKTRSVWWICRIPAPTIFAVADTGGDWTLYAVGVGWAWSLMLKACVLLDARNQCDLTTLVSAELGIMN